MSMDGQDTQIKGHNQTSQPQNSGKRILLDTAASLKKDPNHSPAGLSKVPSLNLTSTKRKTNSIPLTSFSEEQISQNQKPPPVLKSKVQSLLLERQS